LLLAQSHLAHAATVALHPEASLMPCAANAGCTSQCSKIPPRSAQVCQDRSIRAAAPCLCCSGCLLARLRQFAIHGLCVAPSGVRGVNRLICAGERRGPPHGLSDRADNARRAPQSAPTPRGRSAVLALGEPVRATQ
jgi:hypothetical protein